MILALLLAGCQLLRLTDPSQEFAVEAVKFNKTLNRLTQLRTDGHIDDATQKQIAVWREAGKRAVDEAAELAETGSDFSPQLASLKAANEKLADVKNDAERKLNGTGSGTTQPS